jgi:hypothetical protein
LQINDARCLPIIVPTKDEMKLFEDIFDRSYLIQSQKFSKQISEEEANAKLELIQLELDNQINKLYL